MPSMEAVFSNPFLRPPRLPGKQSLLLWSASKLEMGLPALRSDSDQQRRSLKLHKNRRVFHRHHKMSTLAIIVTIVAIAWLLIVLLQPGPRYHLAQTPDGSIDSPDFMRQLEAMTDTKLQHAGPIDVLANGENFYAAELDAIGNAESNINLEAYIFHRGDVAKRFLDALTERARAGVEVRVVVDPYSRQAFLAVGRTIRGIVSF